LKRPLRTLKVCNATSAVASTDPSLNALLSQGVSPPIIGNLTR
jgi:hypothetical protein